MFKDIPTQAAWDKMDQIIATNPVHNLIKKEWGYIIDWNDGIYGIVQFFMYYDAETSEVKSAVLNTRNRWKV